MKLRRLLPASLAAGVGVAAVANRALAGRAGDLEPPLPGDQGTYRWRGMDVAYTEAGDPEDPDMVLLHGVNAAATSKEFEGVFERLAEEYHVLAPDLPGFGLSDRPPLVYSASLYEAFVSDFLGDTTEDATVVASSLTASYAVAAAEEADVERLVLICPTATSIPGRSVLRRTLFRSPLVGTALYNLVASKPSIDYFSADHGYYDPENKSASMTDYQWETAHQPGARYAPASFVSGFLDPEMDLGTELAALDVPVTLVWGREAEITPLSAGRELATKANARLVVVDYAKLQPHAEHPEAFLDALAADLPRLEHE